MFTINAEVRKEQGKGASRRLRAANKFPAIIYGGKEAPLAIELDHDKVMNMQVKAEFYSEVLTIVVDGKEVKMQVSVGDKVIYSKYAGTEVKLGDEEFIVVRQNDIVAIVED